MKKMRFSIIKESKYKIVLSNGISAILIVLFWFILYYFFNNHFFQCSSKEECLMLHQGTDWEFLNTISFFIVYFVIEMLNCPVNDFSYGDYAFIQVILDFAIFCLCFEFMEKTSWFLLITRVNGSGNETIVFKALIHYFLQYSFAFVVSNLIMGMIYGIRKFYRCRRK